MREFQDVRVGWIRPVAADPHVVLVVDGDPVVRRRPRVLIARAAPRLHEIAFGIELEDRRRRNAALADRRVRVHADFGALIQRRVATMDDEDVVVRVHAHADRRAQQPMIRQGLGPERVDLEPRRVRETRGHRGLELRLARRQRGDQRDERACDHDIATTHEILPPAELRVGVE